MTALFLLAHQDDEFAAFYEIARLRTAGERVIVTYLTNGAHKSVTAGTRNAESAFVLAKLGIAPADIIPLGTTHAFTNKRLHISLDAAYAALLAHPFDNITAIYTVAWEGGHPDHDATFLLAVALARQLGNLPVYQFPLYNSHQTILFNVMRPIPCNGDIETRRIPLSHRLRHIAYVCSYRSQWKTYLALLPFFIAHYCTHGGQSIQKTDMSRIGRRPHDGALLYERRRWLTWEAFCEATVDFQRQHCQTTHQTLPD